MVNVTYHIFAKGQNEFGSNFIIYFAKRFENIFFEFEILPNFFAVLFR